VCFEGLRGGLEVLVMVVVGVRCWMGRGVHLWDEEREHGWLWSFVMSRICGPGIDGNVIVELLAFYVLHSCF